MVRVLILIHEDELKLPLVMLRDVRVLAKKRDRFLQQIVEIQRVGLLLFLLVATASERELIAILEKVRILFRQHIGKREAGVELVAEHIREDFALGRTLLVRVEF